MISRGNAPTADQKRWMQSVRDFAEAEAGSSLEIHHPVGRSAKIKGVGNIGHWWLVPVDSRSHRHIHAGAFGKDRKILEKRIFATIIGALPDSVPRPPVEVIEAIEGYHK